MNPAYWIGITRDCGRIRAAVYYRNTDTEATQVGGSERRGLFAVWRTRRWARTHGCDRPAVRWMGGTY